MSAIKFGIESIKDQEKKIFIGHVYKKDDGIMGLVVAYTDSAVVMLDMKKDGEVTGASTESVADTHKRDLIGLCDLTKFDFPIRTVQ